MSSAPRQLALALEHSESFAREDFLGGPSNASALKLIDLWPAWPHHAVMLTGPPVSFLARDTMFAVIMIVFNGMAGLALLLGGLRYHEQSYNLQGANAFLAVILPLAVIGLVLPNFTISGEGPTLSTMHEVFLIFMSLALYGVFLAIQTLSHRKYFLEPGEKVTHTWGVQAC